VKLIFAAADGKNHAKITQICHSGGCNNMEMLMFRVPKLDYQLQRTVRREHLPIHVRFGGCAVSRARSEVLTLAPLIFMRVHGSFELCVHNACKYASKRAMQKVGVLST
jgi:hypothetical protein